MSMSYVETRTRISFSEGYALRPSPHGSFPDPLLWEHRPVLNVRAARGSCGEQANREFSFGPFRLLPGSRTLLHRGQPVECGSRAFDLLHILLLSRGSVVSKDDIVRHVWPTTCVEESNLRFQMASLRKVLGAYRDLIKTIPGRGYLLASDPLESVKPGD
jgi:DNA-binding winged helix-turn-helix (wHTH) protein